MVRRNNPVRIDPDVDLRVPADRSELSPYPAPVLLAVSAGGALGAACRWSLDVALPHPPGGFPWATLAVNVAGSLLIGVVMAVVTGIWSGRRLVRSRHPTDQAVPGHRRLQGRGGAAAPLRVSAP